MRTSTVVLTASLALGGVAGLSGSALAAGLTEPQALFAIEQQCDNVSNLGHDRGGNWHATCSKGAMKVDPSGQVTADKATPGSADINEGQALYILANKCDNVSSLSEDKDGNFHGTCSKGNMVVTTKGEVKPDTGASSAEITQTYASEIANSECNNVSNLKEDDRGDWMGYCSRGPFVIDPSGKIAFR